MDRNTYLKISAAIFIFLAVIISLFPPFEFGNEKLRTISERRTNSDIADKLPIKKYDFIFSSNKKDIIVSCNTFQKKFYIEDQNSLEYYKKLWHDKEFTFNSTTTDTFKTIRLFLKMHDKIVGNINKSKRGEWTPKPYGYYIPRGRHLIWYEDTEWVGQTYTIKYDKVEDALNYNEVKNEYEKSPNDWGYKDTSKIDSIKKYNDYSISSPVYYLLDRKILLGELMIEYILAFFVSIILGYGIQVIRLKKISNVKTKVIL